jgi:hypothetical protein
MNSFSAKLEDFNANAGTVDDESDGLMITAQVSGGSERPRVLSLICSYPQFYPHELAKSEGVVALANRIRISTLSEPF